MLLLIAETQEKEQGLQECDPASEGFIRGGVFCVDYLGGGGEGGREGSIPQSNLLVTSNPGLLFMIL